MADLSQRFSFDPNIRKILVNTGKVEIGQHVHHAFRKIVADILEINIARVQVAPVSTQFSPDDGMTVGSLSVQITGANIRDAAFTLRAALFEEAAQKLRSNSDDIVLDPHTLEASAGGQRCSIFDLPVARDLSTNKSDSDTTCFNPIIAASVRGERFYIQDFTLPGMMYARALRSCLIDANKPLNVRHITDGGFSAIVADSEALLEHAWSQLEPSTAARDRTCDGPVQNWIRDRNVLTQTIGDTTPVQESIQTTATRPFLLHASIAPSCAIALYNQGVLTIWTHSQGIFPLRDTLASHLNMLTDKIIVNHIPSAGCYGHNAADDAVMDAVLVCLQVEGIPVRVTWTRQDDFQHAPVGAPMHVQIDAQLNNDNSIKHWHHTIWSGPHGQRPGGGGNVNLLAAIEQDPQNKSTNIQDLPLKIGGGATRNATPPYSIKSCGVTSHVIQDLPVRTSSIRGLGAQINVVCIEAMMDKLADSCETHRLQFRLKHLTDPRGREILRRLSIQLDTATIALQDGETIGLGYSRYKEKAAYAAVAVRIRLTETVELLDVWAVVDAGNIVERSGALNQIEGGIIQAASWTLCEGALLKNGYIDAAGWEDYPIMGWSGIPAIHTTLVDGRGDSPSHAPSLGLGECMVGPVSAAIVNAVSTEAGCSMTDLPLVPEKFVLAASTDSDG